MAKNGCGQFIAVATIYSNDAFNNTYGHAGFEDSSTRFSSYSATSDSTENSSLNSIGGTEVCGCVSSFSQSYSSSYSTSANSSINTEVDEYGSIIIKNSLESSAVTNGTAKTIDNEFLVYCAPVTYVTDFKQNGSTTCSNKGGTGPFECNSVCSTSQTGPTPELSYNSDAPCTTQAPFSPPCQFCEVETETNIKRKYKYKFQNNQQWEPSPNACWSFSCETTPCYFGSTSFEQNKKVEMNLGGAINMSSIKNTRMQAISKRLDIYAINGPQNKDGDKCNTRVLNGPRNMYDCWDFGGIEWETLFVNEDAYSWKVRFKPYVFNEGLPTDVTEFTGILHAYAVPALFDEYGDAYLPMDHGLDSCNCGSKITDDIEPIFSRDVSVNKDGDKVGLNILSDTFVDFESSSAPVNSFILYCVEDTTYQ